MSGRASLSCPGSLLDATRGLGELVLPKASDTCVSSWSVAVSVSAAASVWASVREGRRGWEPRAPRWPCCCCGARRASATYIPSSELECRPPACSKFSPSASGTCAPGAVELAGTLRLPVSSLSAVPSGCCPSGVGLTRLMAAGGTAGLALCVAPRIVATGLGSSLATASCGKGFAPEVSVGAD